MSNYTKRGNPMSNYMYAKCCVPRCKSTSQTTHLHRFPRVDKRIDIWKELIGDENVTKRTLSQLKNTYVCHLHFEPRYRSKACGRLKRDATPTIFFAQSDHSDIESVTLEDGQSDGEGDNTSPIREEVETVEQDDTKESMLSDAAVTSTAETTDAENLGINSEEYVVLETMEGVNQPLIASMADEYESMCMEIIGELPEDPPPLKETPVAVKIESETRLSQPLPPPISVADTAKQKLRRTVPPTWRPLEDVPDREHIAAAVINTNHPLGHLSKSTEILLREHMYKLLDEAALNSDENFKLPEFHGWSYRDGIFQVRCADIQSRDWLAQAVSLVPTEKLSVVSVQVPGPLVRASIWVPDDVNPVNEIKQRLTRYATRQGLDVSGWRIFQHISKQSPRGTLIVVGMPTADMVRVKEKGNRILYRLDALKVNFLEPENQSREDEPSSSSVSKAPPH